MPLSDYPSIQSLIDNGYKFKFGKYIEDGFNLFKKGMGNYALFVVEIGVICYIFFKMFSFSPSITSAIVLMIALALFFILFIPGFYVYSNNLRLGKEASHNDFYECFKAPQQLLLKFLAVTVITVIVNIPYYYFIGQAGYFDWIQAAYYLAVAYMWTDMYIVLKGMNFWDAMEASRQVITKKWFVFFGFFIVLWILGIVGIFVFCFGFLLSFPAVLCMHFEAFADINELNEIEREDDILDHLVKD